MFGFGKRTPTETPRMFDRTFHPSQSSVLNNFQQETEADGDFAREAQYACQVLNRPRSHNLPSDDGLRAAWKGREAEYLFARFAAAFHWDSLSQAERFYRRNK